MDIICYYAMRIAIWGLSGSWYSLFGSACHRIMPTLLHAPWGIGSTEVQGTWLWVPDLPVLPVSPDTPTSLLFFPCSRIDLERKFPLLLPVSQACLQSASNSELNEAFSKHLVSVLWQAPRKHYSWFTHHWWGWTVLGELQTTDSRGIWNQLSIY